MSDAPIEANAGDAGPAPHISGRGVLSFLCAVLFLDALGFAIVLPVLPELIGSLSQLQVGEAAEVGGWLLFAYAGMQFLASPTLGALSDRYGRRPILLIALAGFAANYFIMAVAPTLAWLFVARILSGVCGATFPAANAAIIDSTPPAERARRFGLSGAAVGLGFVFGPFVGGALGEIDARLPFIVAGCVTLAATVYGFFALPETLPEARRRPFDWKRANPFGSLLSIARRRAVALVLASVFLLQLASQSYVSIWAFYAIERYGWSPFFIALPVGFYGVLIAIMQGFLTGPVIRRLGERAAALFSMTLGLVAYVLMGLAAAPPLVYVAVAVGCCGAFAFPAMQAIMSRQTSEDAQGELQGAVASSASLTAIIGPVAMTQLFHDFTEAGAPYVPGAPFFLSAALIFVCIGIFVFATRRLSASGQVR